MDITQKKAVVGDFLERCNRYADEKLAGYRERLRLASAPEAAVLEGKIAEWSAYRRFNEYTLGELEGDTLDHWFG